MKLTNKGKAINIRDGKEKETKKPYVAPPKERTIADELVEQFDQFHSLNMRNDYDLDESLLRDEIGQLRDNNLDGVWDNSLITFSPSSADKCERDLYFKMVEGYQEDGTVFHPYQKRWVRNGSAVHRAIQSDLAYMREYMPDAPYRIHLTPKNKYAWERNTRKVKVFNHNGQTFQIYGMMDGLLEYTPTGELIGFDAKTKSTTIAAVGDFKLKSPQEANVQQMVGYSLLFGINRFIIFYESLAKDGWLKGSEARNDTKAFLVEITDKMRNDLLDKLSEMTKNIKAKEMPDGDFNKCIFCTFKSECEKVQNGN
jgi:CRISPR/Cas system-associated exonuclease Cas4 (RecB family)